MNDYELNRDSFCN